VVDSVVLTVEVEAVVLSGFTGDLVLEAEEGVIDSAVLTVEVEAVVLSGFTGGLVLEAE
jgi:fatty acid/phospholipid biosynthesis enzyme